MKVTWCQVWSICWICCYWPAQTLCVNGLYFLDDLHISLKKMSGGIKEQYNFMISELVSLSLTKIELCNWL